MAERLLVEPGREKSNIAFTLEDRFVYFEVSPNVNGPRMSLL